MNPDSALGIPAPQGPTLAPPQVQLQMLQLAIKYLLYERAEQTMLSMAFVRLCEERHANFHKKHVYLDGEKKGQQVTFAECSNDVCTEARQIVASTQKREIFINPLSAQLMGKYVLNFMPMPNTIRFWLAEQGEQPQAKAEPSRIILAG